MRSLLVVVALFAIACRSHAVAISPHQLAPHAAKIIADGEFSMTNPDGRVIDIEADEEVEVLITDVDGPTQRPMRLTVADLVAGCVGGIEQPGCLAMRAPPLPPIEHRHLHFDKERFAYSIVGALVGGGLMYCFAECYRADVDPVKSGAAVGGGILLGGAAVVLLFLLAGH